MSDTSPVIEKIELHPVAMQLVESLQTSGWNDSFRPAIMVEIHAGGQVGWGECVAGWTPGYCYETIGTALHVLSDFIVPALLGKSLEALNRTRVTPQYRGHPLTKSAIDMALCDLNARLSGQSLSQLMGQSLAAEGATHRRERVVVGVSIGIHPTIDETVAIIDKRVKEGYGRVKLKIKPGWDVELLREVRRQFPHILLMADANSAYTMDNLATLKKFDEFRLLMVEQPLGNDDIYEHSLLQKHLETPICLDESIHTVDDARLAIDIGACRIINLKVSRVGGIRPAIAMHNFCYNTGVPLWIGGMLETGIGRAANLIVAGLPGITLPSDISATNRYYDPDLTDEVFTLDAADSTITVPTGVGLGVTLNRDRLAVAEDAFARFPKTKFMAPSH
jgi:O-succinylbenzoate synthase